MFVCIIGQTTAVFMLYKPLLGMRNQTGRDHQHRLGSNIISASMEHEFWKDMYKPFTLVFRNTKVVSVFFLQGYEHLSTIDNKFCLTSKAAILLLLCF